MSTIKEIIHECLFRGISVELAYDARSTDGFAYVVSGFAKSGNAKLIEHSNGEIVAHLRYNTVEIVSDFESLARICFRWCEGYKERGYDYGQWADTFEEFGWIKKVVETKTNWVTQ